ncbi:EamA family transporter [Amnibacterium kyonggiense]|uniref:EamA-like transporter family protein n=1 Tax=Amnibacterium kyonggiense TaxID=595671 RepID=A0A4R7FG72_9MICO|nr:EamA family transporter [Amnibacterium kyonggiense]TDS75577.1 EamA-like transporter family protein [Amnibacterium kyonggiense]
MTVVVLGLVSSLLYGVSDFFGAVGSRTRSATEVAFGALVVSGVTVLPAFAIVESRWSWSAVVFGALAGAAAGVGVLLLYAALAVGPVGFVSPVVALMSAVLPALWAFSTGEGTSPPAIAALAAIVVGGVLIGAEPDAGLRPRPRTVVLTLVTGVVYAAYFVFMDATPEDSGAVPMLSDSVAAVVAVGVLLLVSRRRGGAAAPPTRREVAVIVAAGLTQGVATVLLVTALHLPGLAIVSALSALYPATTVGLAVVVLHERLRARHAIGLLVAVAGVAGLALARG